jgi:hypothetical protein
LEEVNSKFKSLDKKTNAHQHKVSPYNVFPRGSVRKRREPERYNNKTQRKAEKAAERKIADDIERKRLVKKYGQYNPNHDRSRLRGTNRSYYPSAPYSVETGGHMKKTNMWVRTIKLQRYLREYQARKRLRMQMDKMVEPKGLLDREMRRQLGPKRNKNEHSRIPLDVTIPMLDHFHGNIGMVVFGEYVNENGVQIWRVQLRNGLVREFTNAQMEETKQRAQALARYHEKQQPIQRVRQTLPATTPLTVVRVENPERPIGEPSTSRPETWVVQSQDGIEVRLSREEMDQTDERRAAKENYERLQGFKAFKKYYSPDF